MSILTSALVVDLVLLTAIYPLRIAYARYRHEAIKEVNKVLRKYHVMLGILAIVLMVLHMCIDVGGGTITGIPVLILLILATSTYYRRDKIGSEWLRKHRIYIALMWIIIVVHACTA